MSFPSNRREHRRSFTGVPPENHRGTTAKHRGYFEDVERGGRADLELDPDREVENELVLVWEGP